MGSRTTWGLAIAGGCAIAWILMGSGTSTAGHVEDAFHFTEVATQDLDADGMIDAVLLEASASLDWTKVDLELLEVRRVCDCTHVLDAEAVLPIDGDTALVHLEASNTWGTALLFTASYGGALTADGGEEYVDAVPTSTDQAAPVAFAARYDVRPQNTLHGTTHELHVFFSEDVSPVLPSGAAFQQTVLEWPGGSQNPHWDDGSIWSPWFTVVGGPPIEEVEAVRVVLHLPELLDQAGLAAARQVPVHPLPYAIVEVDGVAVEPVVVPEGTTLDATIRISHPPPAPTLLRLHLPTGSLASDFEFLVDEDNFDEPIPITFVHAADDAVDGDMHPSSGFFMLDWQPSNPYHLIDPVAGRFPDSTPWIEVEGMPGNVGAGGWYEGRARLLHPIEDHVEVILFASHDDPSPIFSTSLASDARPDALPFLSFSASDWHQWKPFRFQVAPDPDPGGAIAITLRGRADEQGADAGYNRRVEVYHATVTATAAPPWLEVRSDPSWHVDELETIWLRLTEQPLGDVKVSFFACYEWPGQDGCVGFACPAPGPCGPPSVVFTPDNWDVWQEVPFSPWPDEFAVYRITFSFRGYGVTQPTYDSRQLRTPLEHVVTVYGTGKDNPQCAQAWAAGGPDLDEDGIPDPCTGDSDLDGLFDPDDNCPVDANPTQEDSDRDGIGDPCDATPRPVCPAFAEMDGDYALHPGDVVRHEVKLQESGTVPFHVKAPTLVPVPGLSFDAGAWVIDWTAPGPGSYRGSVSLETPGFPCRDEFRLSFEVVAEDGCDEPTPCAVGGVPDGTVGETGGAGESAAAAPGKTGQAGAGPQAIPGETRTPPAEGDGSGAAGADKPWLVFVLAAAVAGAAIAALSRLSHRRPR